MRRSRYANSWELNTFCEARFVTGMPSSAARLKSATKNPVGNISVVTQIASAFLRLGSSCLGFRKAMRPITIATKNEMQSVPTKRCDRIASVTVSLMYGSVASMNGFILSHLYCACS